jgi:phage repressor protein C with HTH and peptisase S24 domain
MLDAQKLIEIREKSGLNQAEFAARIGYSREVVSKVENEKMEPSKWFVEAIQKFQNDQFGDNYSGDVKILGKISHRGSKIAKSYFEQRREQKNVVTQFLVPLVGIKAQAGYVKGFEQTDFLETLERFSLPPGVNPKGLEWSYFEVDGDSMEPSISAGDILLTSLLPHEDWNDIKNNGVYVILTEEQLLVKRVQQQNGQWLLMSDNSEAYPPVPLSLSKIKQVWTSRRHIRSKITQPS